jgi:shikimate kinase
MAYQLKRSVVLVGMMGAGKTAVGTALARQLDVAFLDQDDEIEAAANRTIAEIFRDYGEAFFRERETRVLERLLALAPCVLSTGGGAFLSDRNRDLIAEQGVAVWLDAGLDLLWARVRHRSTRPLLQTADPYGTLGRLYGERRPVYAMAPIHITARPDSSVEDMAALVIRTLLDHPDVLKEVEDAGHH